MKNFFRLRFYREEVLKCRVANVNVTLQVAENHRESLESAHVRCRLMKRYQM